MDVLETTTLPGPRKPSIANKHHEEKEEMNKSFSNVDHKSSFPHS
jgi:hypothetical protein